MSLIGVLTDGFFQVFDQPASILRMNALKKCLKLRYTGSRIESVQAVDFLRTVGDLSGGDIPCPTPCVAQALRFSQIGLASL